MFKKIDDPKKLLLRVARLFASSPERWTRCASARDKNRNPVDVESSKAFCFCSHGAITRLGASIDTRLKAGDALTQALGMSIVRWNDIIRWNDSRGPRGAKVVARKFREAAALV
jgi:hypothetical protein